MNKYFIGTHTDVYIHMLDLHRECQIENILKLLGTPNLIWKLHLSSGLFCQSQTHTFTYNLSQKMNVEKLLCMVIQYLRINFIFMMAHWRVKSKHAMQMELMHVTHRKK